MILNKKIPSYILFFYILMNIFNISAMALVSSKGYYSVLKIFYNQDYSINKIEIENLKLFEVLDPTISTVEDISNAYSVEMVDKDNRSLYSYYTNFSLSGDKVGEIFEKKESVQLPFYENAVKVVVKKNGNIIASKDFIQVESVDNRNIISDSIKKEEENVLVKDLNFNTEETVVSKDGLVSFYFPKSSFKENVTLILEKLDSKEVDYLGENKETVSGIYQIRAKNKDGEEVTKLNKEMTIKFKIDKNYNNKIGILNNDNSLKFLDSTFTNNEIIAKFDTLSTFFVAANKASIANNNKNNILLYIGLSLFAVIVAGSMFWIMKRIKLAKN